MGDTKQHERWRDLYDGIGRLLLGNQLEPTPANYMLAYRYVSGQAAPKSDPAAPKQEQAPGFRGASVAAIELSAADLQRMIGEAQTRLAEVNGVVISSRAAAHEYGDALATNVADLAAGAAPGVVVGSLVSLTKSMVDQTRGVEEQLRSAAEEIRQLRDGLAEAQDAAHKDALTGLPNRRALDLRLATAHDKALRDGCAFSLAICDIDHFKAFNDRYGHQIGDEVIKFVASSLNKEVTERLFAARYGGEEFVVLFEGLDARMASSQVDRIRAAVGARELKFNATGQALGRLTFSAGIAQLKSDDDGMSSLLRRADTALYQAKNEGRNRVIVAA